MTFTMWSLGHYIFMVSPIIATIILHYSAKHLEHEKKRKLGIILSWIAVHVLILRNLEIWINSGYQFNVELVPLQVCHFANFVLLYAFMKDSKPAFGLAFTLNLVAAFVSILFADSLANYSTILTLRGMAYIVGHILIVVIAAWAYMNNFILMDLKTYIKTLKVTGVLYFSSILVNNFFGIVTGQYSNYFYTNHPERGTPLEWFWNMGTEVDLAGFKFNIVYIIGTAIFGFIITLMVYGFAQIFKKEAK